MPRLLVISLQRTMLLLDRDVGLVIDKVGYLM